jgi:hypothetical protein
VFLCSKLLTTLANPKSKSQKTFDVSNASDYQKEIGTAQRYVQ